MGKGRYILGKKRTRITCPDCNGVAVETKGYFVCLSCPWAWKK